MFLPENAFLRNIRKQAKKGKKSLKELAAPQAQGVLPNFQRMFSDDRKTPAIRTGNSSRQTRKGKLSGWLSFFEESNLECWEKGK